MLFFVMKLFFHKYFSKKLAREDQIKAAAAKRKKKGLEGSDDEDEDEDEEDVTMDDVDEGEEEESTSKPKSKGGASADEDEESDAEEDEIWKVGSTLSASLVWLPDLVLIFASSQAMQASMPQAGYDDDDLLEDSDEDEDLDISDEQDSAGEESEGSDDGGEEDDEDGRIDDAGKSDGRIPDLSLHVMTPGFFQTSKMMTRTSCQSTRTRTTSSISTTCPTFLLDLATLELTTPTMKKRSSPESVTMPPKSASATPSLPMARRRRSERSFPSWRVQKTMQRSSTTPRRRISRLSTPRLGSFAESLGSCIGWFILYAYAISLQATIMFFRLSLPFAFGSPSIEGVCQNTTGRAPVLIDRVKS